MLEKSQVVFGAEKDALTFSGLYLNTKRGALPVAIAKPLSNVTGGGVRVTLDYMGTDIVLAIGYGTYKLTAEDTKAYQLVNSLDPRSTRRTTVTALFPRRLSAPRST